MDIPKANTNHRGSTSGLLASNSMSGGSESSSPQVSSIKKISSSPILSNLPRIYHNLRGSDKSNQIGSSSSNDSTPSSKTNFLKKILSGGSNRSSEDLNESISSPSPPPLANTPPTPPTLSVPANNEHTFEQSDNLSMPLGASNSSSNEACAGTNNPESRRLSTENRRRSIESHLTSSLENESNFSQIKNKDHSKIPSVFLNEGLPLLKFSHKSKKRIYINFDPHSLLFSWKSAPTSASMLTSTSRLLMPSTSHTLKSKTYEFSIDEIKSITYQSDASNYREELHVSKKFEDQWLSMIYYDNKKKKLKTLHVIADTQHDFKKLVAVIEIATRLKNDLTRNFFIDYEDADDFKKSIVMGKAIEEKDKQVKEFLSFNDILKYLKRLNININPNYLEKIFNRVLLSNSSTTNLLESQKTLEDDSCHFEPQALEQSSLLPVSKNVNFTSSPTTCLNFEQFKEFVSILKTREDINYIWQNYCDKFSHVMYINHFKKFSLEVQNESYSNENLTKIFRKFSGTSNDFWVPENLNNYLLSKYNTPFKDIDSDESYFDHPLNEYFISSSHNTYLMGRQVAGDSSVEGYIKALHRGCRCVEIDVWDGTNDELGDLVSEPIVSHGHTFTTEISFENVIKAIKKYAFITSPYPLIISLEINCSIENQLKVVQILKDILGETLITEPLDDTNSLPTPLQLKHRILVKAKKTSPFTNLVGNDIGNIMSTSTTTSFSEDNSTNNGTTPSRRSSFSSLKRRRKGAKISDQLSDLGVYLQGIKFRNFSLPESKTFNHCFSLSEKSFNSMLKDPVKQSSIDKHNRKYFMRIYPSKMRLRSSNFIPIQYWSHGSQMVATNWQTYDLGQQINESMFESVRKKGFVHKPLNLRKPLLKSEKHPMEDIKEYKFNIKIISAHQLPKPKNTVLAINPFITFEIIGARNVFWDPESCTLKTPMVSENGFNPIWNSTFSGKIVSGNELVFIRLLVNSSSSSKPEEVTTLGIFVSRLFDLKTGYRYLPINDLFGEELVYSSLFLKINYEHGS